MLVPLLQDNEQGPTSSTGPILVSAIPALQSTAGIAIAPFDVSPFFSGADTYSVDPAALPPGITFAGSTFTGTPSTISSYSIVVTATNGSGTISAPAFGWNIAAQVVAIPPALILENSFVQRQPGVFSPLADVLHQWGADLVLSPAQDLMTVS